VLSGPGAAQRASLILSIIAGFQLMRQIIALPALTEAEPTALVRQLEKIFYGMVAAQ